jgi:hypothetical protein
MTAAFRAQSASVADGLKIVLRLGRVLKGFVSSRMCWCFISLRSFVSGKQARFETSAKRLLTEALQEERSLLCQLHARLSDEASEAEARSPTRAHYALSFASDRCSV